MSKNIIRVVKKTDNFVVMDKTGLNDERLSRKAKGMLSYMLWLPDDREINVEDLKKRSKDWRDWTASWLKELQKFWYLIRGKRQRWQDGKLWGYDYELHEIPNHIGKSVMDDWDVWKSPKTKEIDHDGKSVMESDTTNHYGKSVINNNWLHNSNYISIQIDNILYDNIYLLDKEYNKLLYKYNILCVHKKIIELSDYLKREPDKYKNHYRVLLNRLKKDESSGKLAIPITTDWEEVYDTIKKYSIKVDGKKEDCERLAQELLDLFPTRKPSDVLNEIINAMIKTGQSAYYSIANPKKISQNLGTILTKTQTSLVKGKKWGTAKIVNGKVVVS